MIDDRFLGEWISERTGNRWDFQGSNITVVGKLYILEAESGLPFDVQKWSASETSGTPPFHYLHFINSRNEVRRFLYQFKKEGTEVELAHVETKLMYDVLHRV